MMSKSPAEYDRDGSAQQSTNMNTGSISQMMSNQQGFLEAAFAQEKQRQFLAQQFQGQMFSNAGGNPLLQAATANQVFLNNLAMLQRANSFQNFHQPASTSFPGGLDLASSMHLISAASQTQAPLAAKQAPPQKPGYRDASIMPDPVVFKSSGIDKNGRRGGTSEQFPQKLHRMLSELAKNEGGIDVASFLPHGRAFVIHNPKKFATEVMPKYFRMSRFSSFQRQLNLYDFRRIADGVDKGAYYHELFLDRRPALCTQMKRTKIKGQTPGGWLAQRGNAFREEINFYSMSPIQEARPLAAVPVAPTIENTSNEE